MKRLTIMFAAAAWVSLAASACADWTVGDAYKMHYPQLPDPTGWDVATAASPSDDWKCTATGPVTDLHFWYSWRDDRVGQISMVQAQIYADDRTGEFSRPGEFLWRGQFTGDQIVTRLYGEGEQGFFNPNIDGAAGISPNDHKLIYQANITNIPDPFVQTAGEIYWLQLSVPTDGGALGWKTSLDAFEDVAIYYNLNEQRYLPLYDPLTQAPLSFAFVITGVPEPSTAALALMILGLATLGFTSRHRT
ncbi:MAG: PEP-CTERM sorting domain-containing protein [Planctomycetales bacterium]|nr:PEP-CTERM sorting domain-containing protein [Planctomycetales bacterium]